MKRGGSSGGGQSSLGYLFGSEKEEKKPSPAAQTACMPPYGIDTPIEVPKPGDNTSNIHYRAHGQNSAGNFITGRPSTKVNSAPGGDSSLGYLFGDK